MNTRNRIGPAAVSALLLAAAAPARSEDLPAHAPGEVLIRFRSGSDSLERDRALARAGLVTRKSLGRSARTSDGAPGLVRAAGNRPVEELLRELERDPAVEYAEPNFACSPVAVANDTYYANGGLWGMFSDDSPTVIGPSATSNQYGSQAEEAWAQDKVGSSTVVVAVVDEGLDWSHPELGVNVWTNPFDPVDGVDNDGNGYVDDVHGWDFINNDRTVYDGGTLDKHGTHVAGTIGARAGNAAGVAGMCWNVTIVPAKFMGASGGYVSDAVEALDYVTALKTRHGLKVVATNNSWSSSSYSRSLHDAVLRAAKRGILTVCAAGNDGRSNDATPTYPASLSTTSGTSSETAATYEAVLSVAALDRYGALPSWSNYGTTSVDLAAPGAAITSTLPGGTYGTWSGTSMAAPHVTGALALLAAANPTMLASELRSRLLTTARATVALAGKSVTGGRLDVSAAVGSAPVVVRDVAVTSMTAPTYVTQGYTPTIQVILQNQGNASETFAVSLTDTPPAGGRAGTPGAPQTVTLAAGATRAVYFTWSTSLATSGSHVLTARAATVLGETDSADNARTATSRVMLSSEGPLLLGISPNAMRTSTYVRATLSGGNFLAGARISFANGQGNAPTVSNLVRAADGQSLTATLYVSKGGPSVTRYWDVIVTNPDGRSSRLTRGLLVSP